MRTAASALPCEIDLIQPASWRDLGELRTLEQVCFPQDAWTLLDLIGVLTLPNIMRRKAVCDESMVGFVAAEIKRSDREVWVATIGVLPEYRRRGNGAALLQTVETGTDLPCIKLNVRASNQPAIQLYESLGYEHLNTWYAYYQDGEDALVFQKIL
jgi:ribosomal protein S18 acetylase RimI-like enzyme